MAVFSGSFSFSPSVTPGYLSLWVMVHERANGEDISDSREVHRQQVGIVHEPADWNDIWPWLMELADTAYSEMSAQYAKSKEASISETNARPSDTSVPSSLP